MKLQKALQDADVSWPFFSIKFCKEALSNTVNLNYTSKISTINIHST